MISFKNTLIAVAGLALAGVGFVAGNSFSLSELASPDTDITQSNTKYRFISPLLECGDYQASNLMNKDAATIKSRLNDYIKARKEADLASSVSVYFRDLNNGPYVSISANTLFTPGSLLKLPVAISAYRLAEA